MRRLFRCRSLAAAIVESAKEVKAHYSNVCDAQSTIRNLFLVGMRPPPCYAQPILWTGSKFQFVSNPLLTAEIELLSVVMSDGIELTHEKCAPPERLTRFLPLPDDVPERLIPSAREAWHNRANASQPNGFKDEYEPALFPDCGNEVRVPPVSL